MEKLKRLLFSQTIKDTSIIFLGLGFAAIVGFVFTVIMARTLGPEQFGIFSAISALLTIVCSIGDMGVAPALINFIPKLKDKRDVLISTSFWFEILVGIIILLFFSVFSIFHQAIIPGSTTIQIVVAGFLAINYLLINFAQGIFTAERRFLRYSFTQIVDAGVKIVIVFVLLVLSRLSIESVLLASVISTILAIVITFGKEMLKIKKTFDRGIFRKLFSFAKWMAVTRVFSVFISRIDVILLNLLSSSFQAGIYSAASRITFLFTLIVSSLGSVINPRFSEFDDKVKVISYIKKLFGLITLISVFMLILALFAKPVIDIVFGKEFVLAIPIFQALIVAMIPFIFSLATVPALLYTFNQPKFVARMTAIQVISMIIIELILIPSLGSYAPPIALGVSNVFFLLVTSLRLSNLLHNKEI